MRRQRSRNSELCRRELRPYTEGTRGTDESQGSADAAGVVCDERGDGDERSGTEHNGRDRLEAVADCGSEPH